MGVMACDRKGCGSIMCFRYSTVHGYICGECFNELVELGPETNINHFMSTQKLPPQIDMGELSREYFGRIFVDNRD